MPIIEAIKKLQEDCVRCVDNLENVIAGIKKDVEKKIEKLGFDIKAKEKEYNAVPGCNFFQNLFSGWGCQRAADK